MKLRTIRLAWFVLVCVAVAVLFTPAAGQQNSQPLPTELLPKGHALIPPTALSPDAQWVAYTVQDLIKRGIDPDEQYIIFNRIGTPSSALGCNVWMTNTRTGEARNLTEGKGNNWGPSWSPDGTQLAFYSDRTGKPQLWVWKKSDSSVRLVSDATVHVWTSYHDAPVWMPDGKRVVVKLLPEGLSVEQAANLSVVAKGEGSKTDRVEGSTSTVFQFLPSPGGGKSQTEVAIGTEPTANANLFLGDLGLVDLQSGVVNRIARNFLPCWFAVSPDGANLAFVSAKGSLVGSKFRRQFDLLVVSPKAGSTPRVLVKDIETAALVFLEISWSPDAKSLSYVETENGKPGECYLVNLSGETRKATDQAHPSFYGGYRAPLWNRNADAVYMLAGNAVWRISTRDRSASELAKIPDKNLIGIVAGRSRNRFWSNDGDRSMVVVTRDKQTKQAGFFKVDLSTGKSLKLHEENKQYTTPLPLYIEAMDDGPLMVYGAQDVRSPDDLWSADFDFKDIHQITRTNPEFSRYKMGTSRLIEWHSANGEKLRGALLLPSDYQTGKRYPLIVNVYGGAMRSDEVNQFGLGTMGALNQNMQLLATRGYAVLSPDAPLRVGTPMKDLAATVLPGIDKAIELGIADPERLGVMGRSYGGYSTLGLLVQTTRFKAAVSWAGLYNLIGMYGRMAADGTSSSTDWAEKT